MRHFNERTLCRNVRTAGISGCCQSFRSTVSRPIKTASVCARQPLHHLQTKLVPHIIVTPIGTSHVNGSVTAIASAQLQPYATSWSASILLLAMVSLDGMYFSCVSFLPLISLSPSPLILVDPVVSCWTCLCVFLIVSPLVIALLTDRFYFLS